MASKLVVSKSAIEKGGARPANNVDGGVYILLQTGKPWGEGKTIPTLILQHKKSGARCRVTAGAFFDYVKSDKCTLQKADYPFKENDTAYKCVPENPFYFEAVKFELTVGPADMAKGDTTPKETVTKDDDDF